MFKKFKYIGAGKNFFFKVFQKYFKLKDSQDSGKVAQYGKNTKPKTDQIKKV